MEARDRDFGGEIKGLSFYRYASHQERAPEKGGQGHGLRNHVVGSLALAAIFVLVGIALSSGLHLK